jgi:hypothetical protein
VTIGTVRVSGFASKVIGQVGLGFAVRVGFAAAAMPRRHHPDYSRAMPSGPGLTLRI